MLAGILLASMAVGVANLFWQVTASYAKTDMVLVTCLWCALNFGLIAAAVGSVVKRLHRRQSYRFPVDLALAVAGRTGYHAIGHVSDISQDGLSILFDGKAQDESAAAQLQRGERLAARLRCAGGWLDFDGEVASVGRLNGGRLKLGVRLLPMKERDRRSFLNLLFVTLPRAICSGQPLHHLQGAQLLPPPRAPRRKASA